MATFCTIIARNYLAQALTLAESLAVHHPGSRLKAAVIDADAGVPDVGAAPIDILAPDDFMSRGVFQVMAGMYPIVEFATAVKPWLLASLIEATTGPVLYLDPDIKVYAPLDLLISQAVDPGVVLTPHLDQPPQRDDGRAEVEDIVLSAGIFNLGFVGVGPRRRDLLEWWQSRLSRECVINPPAQRFVDQRWMDLVPGYFATAVVRDPEYNVAWWNLSTRTVTWDGSGYLVNGRPLGFFHFSGYSPTLPHLVSKHQGPAPRVLLSENPGVARILAEYAANLAAHQHREHASLPNGLDVLPNGVAMDDIMRRLYREAVMAAERHDTPPPPNPYAEPDPFVEWLRQPAPARHATEPSTVARYAARVREESQHLRDRFPDIAGEGRDDYLTWYEDMARVAGHFPVETIPDRVVVARSVPRADRRAGVNLIGYMRSESGVGEAARQIAAGLATSGIPVAAIDYPYSPARQGHAFATIPACEAPYDINLLCINADQILTANHWLGPDLRDVAHRIGVWWWEVSTFPDSLHQAFDVVDELWVGSPFIAETLAGYTDIPIKVFPLPVEVPTATDVARRTLDLGDAFVVLFSFDFESVLTRKNPLAAIEAYRRAFSVDDGAALVIKTINGHRHLNDLERLRFAADRPDIRIIDGYLDHEVKNSLMATCDCYLSLHRSEGFGLTMAEAMAYGRPVVATGYSGNLQFMTPENSWLVPWRPATVPKGTDPYPEGVVWAEADVDAASAALREVRDKPASAVRRGEIAQADIRRGQSRERLAEFAAGRLGEIRASIAASRPSAVEDPSPDAREVLVDRLNRSGDTPWGSMGGVDALKAPARRGLLRALRPYLVRRDQIDRAIVARTDAVEARAEFNAAEIGRATDLTGARLDETVEHLTARIRGLEAAAADARAYDQALLSRVSGVEAELRMPASLDLSGERHWVPEHLARPEMARRWGEVTGRPVAPSTALTTPLTGYEYRRTSQNGEDGVICEIFRRIGVTNRWFVEFGIESGVEGNCVLLADEWSGLFIEPDTDAFGRLASRYQRRSHRVRCLNEAVTRDNINELFRRVGVPASPDIVTIDVDGNDYWLWEASTFTPRVVVIEYNAALGFDRALTVPYDPDRFWDGTDYFGASLAALVALGHRQGYRLVHTDRCGANAFFVRTDLADGRFPDEADVPRHTANYFFSGAGHPPDPQARTYVELDDAPP